MATIAEFSIPTESFALADTLPEFPEVAVEADRIAAHVPDSTMPCLLVDGNGTDFGDALATDHTVEEVEGTVDFGDEQLYHLTWSEDIDQLVTEMVDHQGVILEASGRNDRWLLRIRFMSREQFESFQAHFTQRDPSIRLEQLFQAKHPRHTRGDVTQEQHEALTSAIEFGYFSVPREGSIQDVADALGVSDQAVSERIRRGTENLVRDMLAVERIQDRK
jgi:predicted DNA binding protein